MNKKQLFILITICFTSLQITSSCQKQKLQYSKVIVAGKILNIENHEEHKTVTLHFRDLLDNNKDITAMIDENGTFRVETECLFPQDFFLIYGRLTTLFCSPGDSLFVEIDADIWDDNRNMYPNGKFFARVTGGTSIKDNYHVREFINLEISRRNLSEERRMIKESSPMDYKQYVYNNEQLYFTLLDSFSQENNPSRLFREWAMDHIQYDTWAKLMEFRWNHPMKNKIAIDSFELPEIYYSFLMEYDMNDNDIISIGHKNFLHEYRNYVNHELFPIDSVKEVLALSNEDNKFAWPFYIENIFKNTTGFTRELFTAQEYAKLLSWKRIEEFEKVYDPNLFPGSPLIRRIESQYEKLKQDIENPQFIAGTNLNEVGHSIVNPILDTIAARFQGMVVYIDFWAPWCGPCLSEMPNSKELQNHYADKQVAFVFLAARCTEDAWKKTIAEKQLSGEHFLLSDDQYNILKGRFGFSGIPHYVLLNKIGQVIFDDAPRPSEKSKLTIEIDKLL